MSGAGAIGFTAWLRRQRQRDDATGDLARDAARDREWPRGAGRRALQQHLDRMGASDDARRALDTAWVEWEQARARRAPAP